MAYVAAAATVVAGSIFGGVSAQAATPACATAWSAGTAYSGGATASENGANYTANWWTQGDDPATHSGATGSGQPWTSAGACTGSAGGTGGGGTGGGGTGGGGTGTGSATGTFFSPYKDVTANLNWNTDVMQTAITGSTIPVVGTSNSLVSTAVPNLGGISLAFATGTCGSENWGGVAGGAFAAANIPALDKAGVNYVVSTGGAAGSFTCASGAALNSFIARYSSAHLVGIDFDIETGQTASDIQALVSAAATSQATYPKLRFSFTLATLAASDGSYGGLNSTGDTVVKAIKASSLTNYTINLMTMDYGNGTPSVCVVSSGVCDMGASAVQAAKNLQHTYGTPLTKIELTPMIGVNDSASNVVSLKDVDTISSYAVANKLAGVHYWSLDRDTPCPTTQSTASATCNSMAGSTALQYTQRFLTDLGK
ncbi:hypothetical protein GCM10025867_07730 [Frondihabitans sucicola]|uniref:Chitin-binding type-3 domain-containing protein n=1 Tax=Frondihabitans sucicola TaxID=1268041 RepID=A0ABM8GJH9_9MICO|nr:carbohydrate-binding protein [Frondihabitans sucicola]BDZ48532.1 hypothetical protein GCM10025867_07730 [Frondihabitans sucicola]